MVKQFSHSGDCGDIFASCPALMATAGNDPVDLALFPSGNTTYRMDLPRVNSLRPFLLAQPYINSVTFSEGPNGVNLDEWRFRGKGGLSISDCFSTMLGVPHHNRRQPFFRVDSVNPRGRVVFARCPRWQNEEVNWKAIHNEFGKEAVFLGTPAEHEAFTKDIGPVEYVPTADFLSAARVIAGAEMIASNQTALRWIAEGLGIVCLTEIYQRLNNTHMDRVGAFKLVECNDKLPSLNYLDELYYKTMVQRGVDYTQLSEAQLDTVARLVRSVEHLHGDLLSVNCGAGGVAKVIGGITPQKKLHLVNPVSDQLRTYLSLCDVDFHDMMPDAKYCFAHLDGEDVQGAIDYLLPRMIEGGAIVINQFEKRTLTGLPCVQCEDDCGWFRVVVQRVEEPLRKRKVKLDLSSLVG
jgi:hypothetical protein